MPDPTTGAKGWQNLPVLPIPSRRSSQVTIGSPTTSEMFVVTEVEAAALRAAVDQQGGLWASVELRLLFPGTSTMRGHGNAP